MPTVNLLNMKGQSVGSVELSDAVFGAEINQALLHQVVRIQLANKRQGTQSALTRAEVSGGGKKPYRQKGTGRARQGSTRSPQWKHGGVVFAPKPRSYAMALPRKMRRAALRSALSSKVLDGEMIVLDALSISDGKTKLMAGVLEAIKADRKALVVLADKDELVVRAARNIPGVKMASVGTLNVLDILGHDKFVIVKDAIAQVEEVFA